MSSEGQGVGAVVFGEFPLASGEWFPWHRHLQHQLAWTPRAALTVQVGDAHWVLPPARALWLPAGVSHRTGAPKHTVLRGIYADPRRCPIRWSEPTMVAVPPLLRELVEYLAGDLGAAERRRAERVMFDLLEPVRAIPIGVRRPADPRAGTVADLLVADPSDQRSLSELAGLAGVSSRTLARLFLDGTGLTFGAWRTQVRLRASLSLLADGVPLSGVARRVGYATPSAFVAAFHREVGISPGRYFSS
jgi:AraC-like DNA-binding protein